MGSDGSFFGVTPGVGRVTGAGQHPRKLGDPSRRIERLRGRNGAATHGALGHDDLDVGATVYALSFTDGDATFNPPDKFLGVGTGAGMHFYKRADWKTPFTRFRPETRIK